MAPIKPALEAPEGWLPHQAVRQYHRRGRQDEEIITIGAIICDPNNSAFAEPLAIASMMKQTTSNSDHTYWLPLLGHDERPARVGEVRKLDVREWRGKEDWFNDALKLVSDGQLLTVAVPLLEITTTSDVQDRLVVPLLTAMKSAGV